MISLAGIFYYFKWILIMRDFFLNNIFIKGVMIK